MALADAGRFARAEEVYRDVLRHNPESVPAHVGLGEPPRQARRSRRGVPALPAVLLLDAGNPRGGRAADDWQGRSASSLAQGIRSDVRYRY